MHDDFYGLTGRPFQLTPDARFWFDSATHRKAMAYLGYGLSQGEGFIVITGEVGAGKTTLVGHLMATIDRERLHAIQIVSTQIEGDDLLRLVATGLGVAAEGRAKAQLLGEVERALHAVARSGRRTLLVVDEAQALPVSALEELRMLSNFQVGGHALLQIFLLGQPEFRAALHGSERLEQLRQRVIAVHHLEPMPVEEIEPYLKHRLQLVGWRGKPSFTEEAYRRLHAASDGVPRRLNQLAGRVLLFGAIDRLDVIDGKVVDAVIADIAGEVPFYHEPARPQADPLPLFEAAPAADVPPAPEPPADVVPLAMTEPAVEPEPEPEAVPAAEPELVLADDDRLEPLPMSGMADLMADTPEAEPIAEPEPEAATVEPAIVPAEPDLLRRMAALEARADEQDAALRRVLTLLVDWVEGDTARPDAARLRG